MSNTDDRLPPISMSPSKMTSSSEKSHHIETATKMASNPASVTPLGNGIDDCLRNETSLALFTPTTSLVSNRGSSENTKHTQCNGTPEHAPPTLHEEEEQQQQQQDQARRSTLTQRSQRVRSQEVQSESRQGDTQLSQGYNDHHEKTWATPVTGLAPATSIDAAGKLSTTTTFPGSSSMELRRLSKDTVSPSHSNNCPNSSALRDQKSNHNNDNDKSGSVSVIREGEDEEDHDYSTSLRLDMLGDVPGSMTAASSKCSEHGHSGQACWMCLRSGFSLWTQLMLSFGSISLATVHMVVSTCIVVAVLAGNEVQKTGQAALEQIARDTQTLTARFLAESLSEELLLDDSIKLLMEATQDRFAGYPSGIDDTFVPFKDVLTGQNKYPINFPPPPMDWNFTSNVNDLNYREHFQDREYYRQRLASTSSASFFIKGACDPSETDPGADGYWPDCTPANNNVTTGGVWDPTTTSEEIYLKSKDLIPLMKAIFESRERVRNLGIFFANDGAGASLNYPHYPLSTQTTYTSIGCEWLNAPNPYDRSRPIATPDMIRRCNPEGEMVSNRIYNPLERQWCASQALEPDRAHFEVVLDAWAGNEEETWLLVSGQAIYDRITQEFIACTFLSVTMANIDLKLRELDVVSGDVVTLVSWTEEGRVIGTSSESSSATAARLITDLEFGGIELQDYQRLYNLVNFDHEWDPRQVRQRYQSFSAHSKDYFVSVYPMPPIPPTYDPQYRPLFLVVVSTPLDSLRAVVDEASRIVGDQVRSVNRFCVLAGAVGLSIALVVISMMSRMLTRPLRKMSHITSSIVSSFGQPDRKDQVLGLLRDAKQKRKEARCTPQTELSQVVNEFDKMLNSFSGTHIVRSERHKYRELYNMFELQEEFRCLYERRRNEGFEHAIDSSPKNQPNVGGLDLQEEKVAHVFLNSGSNQTSDPCSVSTAPTNHDKMREDPLLSKENASGVSPLFVWIVMLIVTPLLVVNVAIAAVALNLVSNEFAESIEQAQNFFLEVELAKLEVHSHLRAEYVKNIISRTTSDLHLLTRYMGWLLFGGLELSEMYTELTAGTDECKNFIDYQQCPYVQENTICDCTWEDPISHVCENFPNGSRNVQRTWFGVQAVDFDEQGTRASTTFPLHSTSPETTEWWEDQSLVPGWIANEENEKFQAGYATLYQRLRTTSSMPLFHTIYNYVGNAKNIIGTYVAFEADGLYVGYNGCRSTGHVGHAFWISNASNGAPERRGELCPEGKFGYDPRCQGWYDKGRNLALINNTFLHVTSPYPFASNQGLVAQSATASLVDPTTKEHIGQVLYDFSSERMIESLRSDSIDTDQGFPILVATESSIVADAIVGPDYEVGDPPTSIINSVLPFDIKEDCPMKHSCQENVEKFGKIVNDMKSGRRGSVKFSRTTDEGTQELLYLAYSPVAIRSLHAVNHSDFSRGIQVEDLLINSLGLTASESEMLQVFHPIEQEIKRQIRVAIAILSSVLLVAACLVVYVSFSVTRMISEPMVYFLDVIRSIRKSGHHSHRSDQNCNPPDLNHRIRTGSKEIRMFASSIDMLSTVVQSANAAFYAGEFEVAYTVLRDALQLFRRLENDKAIGVACNNLGNVMMGMYQEMVGSRIEKLGGLSKTEVLQKGVAYFNEAIRSGEKAYDEFYSIHGWTPICLDFMQHLSNRYFNRAVFLLSIKAGGQPQITNAEANVTANMQQLEEQGRRDVQIARDMDSEIASYAEDIGWSSDERIEAMFDMKISRLGGYNMLSRLGFKGDWDIADEFRDCIAFLTAERRRPTPSSLFRRIAFPGRVQEIELELMKYLEVEGDVEAAAKVAIRCLMEDEKIFADTMAQAVIVLQKYCQSKPSCLSASPEQMEHIRKELSHYFLLIEDDITQQNQSTMNDAMDSGLLNESTSRSSQGLCWASHETIARDWSLEQSSGRFVTMEDF